MLGGLFKKKETDDFSDFSPNTGDANTPDVGLGTNESHMGLPLDGDITQTSPDSPATTGFSHSPQSPSFSDTPPQGPGAFDRLDSFSKAAEKYTHSTAHSQPTHPEMGSKSVEKDLQIVNAKLDAIKSFMESINQRLMHIERLAEDGKPKQDKIRW